VIYVTASYSRAFALDAKTGRKLWSYAHRLPDDIRPCCDVVNRGGALYGDKFYMGTLDAGIVALDRKTGKVVWSKKFEDHTAGYTMTGAPNIIKDKKTGKVLLIHGSSGDEFGVVGRLYARDPDTGEEIWMRPLVEGHVGRLNGKELSPTGDTTAPSWPNGKDGNKVDAWNHGGGAPWQSATYDEKTNTIVIGTGNPAPWNFHYRSDPNGDWKPYDSLYTSGQVYIEPSTREPVGFFQHTPNDAWDFSGNNPITLFEMEKDGKTIRAGAHADRNGFLFITDLDKLTARDGKISKQAGSALGIYPMVPDISWAKGWDLASGRPQEVEGQRPPAPAEGETKGKTIQVTPNFLGGTNWMPMAYSQQTKLFYIPTNDWKEDYWTENLTYKKGAAYLGQGFRIKRQFDTHVGVLRAMDPRHRKGGLGAQGSDAAVVRSARYQRRVRAHRYQRRLREGLRCEGRQGAMEVPDRIGRRLAARHLGGRWQAVYRSRFGLRRRRAAVGRRYGRPDQAGEPGRFVLGVRGAAYDGLKRVVPRRAGRGSSSPSA